MNWIFFAYFTIAALPALSYAGWEHVQEPHCAKTDIGVKVLQPSDFDCEKCYADAIALSLSKGNENIWIPLCDFKLNRFLPEQYFSHKDESFCVDQYGREHPNSRVKGPKVDCTKFKIPPPMSKCQLAEFKANQFKRTYVPQCNKKGEFAPLQCYGKTDWCWCAQKIGIPIPKTFFNKNWAKDKKHDCDLYRAVKVVCKTDSGVKTHPLSCAQYFVCSPQMAHHCVCPEGQNFDEGVEVCNWANQVKCPKLKPLSTNKENVIVVTKNTSP